MDRFNFGLGVFCLCLTLLSIAAHHTCDKSKCPGPTAYYTELKCLPVYKNPDACCPYKYNCDHLKSRSPDKCYANGHEYSPGESLKDEDKNPCDVGCYCSESRSERAEFICAVVDCFHGAFTPGCYVPRDVSHCCPTSEVCPEKPEDRPTCEVDGKIYKDGEFYKPASEPNKICACGPGYKGENIPPFCRGPSPSPCGTELRYTREIAENCAPVYYHQQSPQQDCSVAYRCQNPRDEVIPKDPLAGPPKSDDEAVCQFGTLLMHYGDELNQATDYSSVCVRCVCEVGPTPTCQRLSPEQCDIRQRPAV